ncbi:tetratricopeptide repeat protein [Macellibacteroides fermentans]|uniref:tetratricopeptide repeat protein n=1 Tax=Macellibacteroides fermentans TaxID=879969 RepID=UPI00406C00DC
MGRLFKLNFEKSVIFVLILILLLSTANIFSQFNDTFSKSKEHTKVDLNATKNIGFPASLLKADQLYMQGLYKDAQGEYLKLTSMPSLSTQQKATVYFKLGICNYTLKEYDLARDSFKKSAEFNSNDPVSYNNAAVCSFYLNELDKAEELQKLAIASLPVIEYHYNLARIYEAWGRYGDSVKYYSAVIRGEENITKEDRIDPVRIKNKVMKLMINMKNIQEMTNELMIALRLKDVREVFIIDDVDMDIKDKKFKWSVADENGTYKLYCSYDREESDPYSLIDSLNWNVERDGKTIFTSKKNKFSLSMAEGGNYVVYLDIDYDASKSASSYVDVTRNSSVYLANVRSKPSETQSTAPKEQKPKYYEYAVYEQVFEKNFIIKEKGYVDRFNVVWGKDDIITRMITDDYIDAQGSIYIKNISNKRAGIWADLSSLLSDKRLKGRTIGIRFYAKGESDGAALHVSTNIKTGETYNNKVKRYQLDSKWKQFVIDLPIPRDADGLTLSFKTETWDELKIDGFIITILK